MKYFKHYREFVNESGFHSPSELTEREYSDEERAKLADKGFALPDGSYPIKDIDDLKNAIQAYGRAKDQAAAAKHIVKRAKALGAEDLVPTSEDFQKSLKEAVTMDAVYIHQITGSGQDSAQNFIDDNGLDGKKLANYVKQHRDSKEKIDVRDMIAGVGIGANKKLRDRFLKQFKESVNESLSSSDKKKFEDFFKRAIGKLATVTADDYSEEGRLEMNNGMYKVDDGNMWIDIDYLVSTNDMKIISISSKKLVYKHGDTWTIEIK